MDAAFHFEASDRVPYLTELRVQLRLLGLLRLLSNFSLGSVEVYGGVFRYWLLEKYLPRELIRKRWIEASKTGWFLVGSGDITETAPNSGFFLVVRNLSTQAAESICRRFKKCHYLKCAFEVSRHNDIHYAIYYQLAERWYSLFSNHAAAYWVPYGFEEDSLAPINLRRAGFTEIARRDELPSLEDTFFLVTRLIDEEHNPKD